MANTKVTGALIADATITAANLVSGTLDTLLNSYLTTNTYATQGYVTTAVNNLIDAAPASLDTLNELAAALNDDANFATTVTNSLATKLNLSGGTLTGTLYAGGLVRLTGTTSSNSQLDLPVDWGALRWYDGTTFKGGIGTAGWSGVGSGNDLTVYLNNGNFHVSNNTSPFVTFDRANERVGIGTTSPSEKLEVNGNVKGGYGIFNAEGLSQNLRVGGIYGDLGLYVAATYDMVFSLGQSTNWRFKVANTTKVTIDGNGSITSNGNISANGAIDAAGAITWSSNTARLTSNQLQSGYGYAGDDADFWINYQGYNGGASYFRDFRIGNGKQGLIAVFDGSSSNVGIGTTSPSHPLHVEGIIATNSSSNGSGILIRKSGVTKGYVGQSGGWEGNSDTDLAVAAETGGNVKFYSGGSASVKMTLLAGGGLTFNGDTAAANALDDYEEGTFTPVVNSGTSTTSWAKYTKIGDLVYIVCEVNLTGTRSATTFEVSGLPFTNGPNWTPCSFYCEVFNAEGTQQATGVFRASTNIFRVHEFGQESLGTQFGNGYFAFSGTYKVN